MKKIVVLFSVLVLSIGFSYGQCVPDSVHLSQSNPVYPASLGCIVQGTAFSGVISIIIPDSLPGSAFGIPLLNGQEVYIDSVGIVTISGYPTGITSSSSPVLGSWIRANGYACAAFSGTTTAPVGNYPLTISGIGCGHVILPFVGRYDTCMAFNFTSVYPYDLQVCNTACSNVYDTMRTTICNGDSIYFNGSYRKRANTYTDTVYLSTGCDTVNYLILSVINNLRPTRDTITNCNPVTLGGTTYSHDTTVTVTLISSLGCDSSVRYTLHIGGIIPTISVSGNSLQATDPAAVSWQWYENGTLISGATSSSYTPTGSGLNTFTVVTTDNSGCRDSSSGWLFTDGIAVTSAGKFALYPNPNNGTFTLETSGAAGATITIANGLGQLVWQGVISTNKQPINTGSLEAGNYTLMVKGSGTLPFTVVK